MATICRDVEKLLSRLIHFKKHCDAFKKSPNEKSRLLAQRQSAAFSIAIKGLKHILDNDKKRKDKIKANGGEPKKVGRPKKYSLRMSDINKYTYL